MRHVMKILVLGVALVMLSACGDPSKGDIIKKAENAGTKADLVEALGKPTEVDKLGPMEKWTYQASDGEVVFLIAGDTITIQVTGDSNSDY